MALLDPPSMPAGSAGLDAFLEGNERKGRGSHLACRVIEQSILGKYGQMRASKEI